ncbi:hypothetical protein MNV49_001963 [Pseudohyphozyma bogoriensis]|nr:hypothetical protein MNV49_001963 [Pseudohyphozyma bogoriensis]
MPASTGPRRVTKALLVAQQFDDTLRRAGLDLISKLKATKRYSAVPSSQTVQLHLVILSSAPEREGYSERRSTTLAAWRDAGATVSLHTSLVPSPRLSLTVGPPTTLRATLLRTLDQGDVHLAFADASIAAAALVCGPKEEAMAEQVKSAFVETIATLVANHPATAHVAPPSLTLYLPQHPFLSDFDLDLPATQLRSVQIATSAAQQFSATFDEVVAAKRERRRSFNNAPAPTPAPVCLAIGTDSNRRHSFTPRAPSPTAAEGAVKPLLLRPAPGVGAASIAMRLSISTDDDHSSGKDLILRVSEAQTPVKEIPPASIITRPPPPSSPSTPTTAKPSLRPLQLPSTLLSRPQKSSDRAASSSSDRPTRPTSSSAPRLQLLIPTRPIAPATTPPLESSFSPESASSPEEENGPSTPPEGTKEPQTPAWDPKLYSPLVKVPPNRQTTLDESEMTPSPNTSAVKALLWLRKNRTDNALSGLSLEK